MDDNRRSNHSVRVEKQRIDDVPEKDIRDGQEQPNDGQPRPYGLLSKKGQANTHDRERQANDKE
ncbi:hypothetical protein GCM10007902_20090 [Dyella nitratireducens]|nr:hypothetical protein GCM10007902_20090 [Dyella nitratireducens]